MKDFFSYSRGRVLLEDTDLYDRFFSVARLKTAEHNIYERSKNGFFDENKKSQKSKKTGEN